MPAGYSKELKYFGEVITLSLHPCGGVYGVNNETPGVTFDLKSCHTFTQADIDKATKAYKNANLRHKLKTDWFEPDKLISPVFFKPKGMHQTTFDKLQRKQRGLLNNSGQILLDRFDL